MPFTRRWLIAGSILALILLIVLVDRTEDVLTHVSYPLTTWRIDLDDAMLGIGTILLGIAAIWTVWLKANRAEAKADQVSKQINGGMSKIAREHVDGALKNADVELGLWRRVDALETAVDDCTDREQRCMDENEKLRDWVIARLDYSTEGRDTER